MSEKSDEKSSKIENSDENSENQNMKFATPEMQEARAFLRERYLRFVTGIVGKNVNFNLYENSKVTGEFRGCDVDGFDIFVRNLKTPLGNIPEAILRTSDVISIDIDDIKNSQ